MPDEPSLKAHFVSIIRAELARVRGGECEHGVDPARCDEHREASA